MVIFLCMSAGVWFLGAQMGVPNRTRWAMIGGIYLGIVALLWLLPATHPLRNRLGGSLAEWLILGVMVALGVVYTQGLRALKARANGNDEPPVAKGGYAHEELPRYARHIMLREIGGSGQKKLKSAKVLVVGAGGLGSPALMYLAAAGVGTIGVIDDDQVEASNLQRQIAHTDDRVGMPKVFSAKEAMIAVNPYVQLRTYQRRLDTETVDELVAEFDLVLDGTDNFATRYLVNGACVKAGVALISGALTQWEGQVSVFHPAGGAPCYQCVFPEAPASDLAPSCAEAGVVGPLPGVVGSMMAVEAIKVITGAGEALLGRMMIYDALYGETRVIKLSRREGCDICC